MFVASRLSRPLTQNVFRLVSAILIGGRAIQFRLRKASWSTPLLLSPRERELVLDPRKIKRFYAFRNSVPKVSITERAQPCLLTKESWWNLRIQYVKIRWIDSFPLSHSLILLQHMLNWHEQHIRLVLVWVRLPGAPVWWSTPSVKIAWVLFLTLPAWWLRVRLLLLWFEVYAVTCTLELLFFFFLEESHEEGTRRDIDAVLSEANSL
jgi:hypothetical protein